MEGPRGELNLALEEAEKAEKAYREALGWVRNAQAHVQGAQAGLLSLRQEIGVLTARLAAHEAPAGSEPKAVQTDAGHKLVSVTDLRG